MMTLDHPHNRASLACALCELPKDVGCVVCWPCYRLHNMRNGKSPIVQTMLDDVEAIGNAAAKGSK